MSAVKNPTLRAFLAAMGREFVIAQVRVRRAGAGWELCHVDEAGTAAGGLRPVSLAELRALAQFTATKQFRPLKAAPTLVAGWRHTAANDEELYEALNRLYPGAVADWFAAQSPKPPVTHLREYTARQTGMYRITGTLPDALAAGVILNTCDASRCLKRRLWTVIGLPPDTLETKSLIPCLEPCAIALEAIRKAARAELDRQAGRSAPAPTTGEG